MKYDWLPFLARPIDGDRRFRGRPLFGHSKTWRGPILVAIGTAAVFAVQRSVLHDFASIAAIELVDRALKPAQRSARSTSLVSGSASQWSCSSFQLPPRFTAQA
ncbi:MAG: hypothetical protein DCC71_02530 [Proteobacteria bacterium]|nr:MAG: hypothetical protein DCC71_02530 [Pseudomonadota bacterium]